jgi:sigma-B regulation protein RsbU (phosphoserine phosphatase)
MQVIPLPHAGDHFEEDFKDFFEHSLSGFVTASADGFILRANARFAQWLGYSSEQLKTRRLSDFLTAGGKKYFDTHLSPLLRMEGFFEEVALEFTCRDGMRLPVFVNAFERQDEHGTPLFIRMTIVKAIDRRKYEETLRAAKLIAEGHLSDERKLSALREQFIAVLSHDLRNPLGAIIGGMQILTRMVPLNEKAATVAKMVQDSATRMGDLINDVMDFARVRLGGGLNLTRQHVLLEPVLQHVVDELRAGWPKREIQTELALPASVNCDPTRLSQLLSNLVANALTHGAADGPVRVCALLTQKGVEISVSNRGNPIPPETITRLFEAFTREQINPNQQGLGLGLYIAMEIAQAHAGTLTATSTAQETRFTLTMPLFV